MRYLIDIFAIFLMGDGLSKLISPVEHNRFYNVSWAPRPYHRFLEKQQEQPLLAVLIGLGIVLGGALLSGWVERKA
jgi:hypothetical protein